MAKKAKAKAKATDQLAFIATSASSQNATKPDFDTSTRAGFEAWIYWHYLNHAFHRDGVFKGLVWLKKHLVSLDPSHSNSSMKRALQPLLDPNHQYSLAHTESISKRIRDRRIQRSSKDPRGSSSRMSKCEREIEDLQSIPSIAETSPTTSLETIADPANPTDIVEDLVGRIICQALLSDQLHGDVDSQAETQDNTSENRSLFMRQGFEDMDFLLPNGLGGNDDGHARSDDEVARIRFAPLIDADIISSDDRNLVPQYGLLGLHTGGGGTKSKLLLNTNIPFSMFLCGVQGSGKSHTLSCILENSLVPSKHLGKLRNSLSALVFSYSQFSGDGHGFTISEAAFLASSDPKLPVKEHVKNVHVLVSPSNFVRISKLYLRLPNVRVTPFKLRPQELDIDTMLTLMNVNGSDETTLYMAQVTQILREMSTTGKPFDYQAFKLLLKQKQFNTAQSSMLQMRLDLLESFLDSDTGHANPHFQPGDITIMDMSCPFVDANTACILFKIGLKLYMQSNANGKMIVLDEAHKYMLSVPGARALNESLLQTIRLQRHFGVRVIISTQEPTLLVDLIPLCSVTVIHRFSSPAWLSAIKRHIPAVTTDLESLMQRIETLTTGKAMVYSPNAVLGRDTDGHLITGTSRFIDVSIRKRMTSDGGQSVLAV